MSGIISINNDHLIVRKILLLMVDIEGLGLLFWCGHPNLKVYLPLFSVVYLRLVFAFAFYPPGKYSG